MQQNLAGVSIVIKNKRFTAVTDNNGNFHIELPSRFATTNFKILFSCIGYNTLTVKVQNKKETFAKALNIFMHPKTIDLNEVIVVGGAFLSE